MNKEKNILRARSKEDGIIFYSNKNPALCYEAIIDKNGKIKTFVTPSIISEIADVGVYLKDNEKPTKKVLKSIKIAIYIIAILSIVITKQVSIAIGMAYFSIIVLRDFIDFCQSSYMLKLGKYQSTGRFHAAEHMVINAYRKKQGIPTMKELRKAKRFDKECGSRKSIDKIVIFGTISFVIALCNFIEQYQYIILLILSIILTVLQNKYGIFKFLQVFVTKKPTDKELEVALAGIKFFEEKEKDIPEGSCPFGGMFMLFEILEDEDEEDSTEE